MLARVIVSISVGFLMLMSLLSAVCLFALEESVAVLTTPLIVGSFVFMVQHRHTCPTLLFWVVCSNVSCLDVNCVCVFVWLIYTARNLFTYEISFHISYLLSFAYWMLYKNDDDCHIHAPWYLHDIPRYLLCTKWYMVIF